MLILHKEQIKEIEAKAITAGFSEIRMMENAGSAAAKIINEKFDINGKKIVIVCGKGNNGGDGFVVARKFFEGGKNVSVILADGMPQTLSAQEELSKLTHYPVRIYNSYDAETNQLVSDAEVLIDAIFGIGFRGEVEGAADFILAVMNQSRALKIALDIPSGAECDTGAVSRNCFKADATISFIAIKPCHVLFPSAEYTGKLFKAGIGLPPQIANSVGSDDIIIEEALIKAKFPKRAKNSHKGTYGRVALLCGSYGMAGAALLSAKASLNSGAGLVESILPEPIYPIVAAGLPEAIFLPYDINNDKSALLTLFDGINKADCVVAGCGLGKSELTKKMINALLESYEKPIVLDADGLNIAALNIEALVRCRAEMVLTPHPAEMARLLNTTVEVVLNNRFGSVRALSKQSGKIVVLKGANSVIALPGGRLYVCTKGNPGMATAGSGDVLAGVIGALISGGMSAEDAAICGTWIHSAAGDVAATQKSMTSMLAGDIISSLPVVFKELEK